ncbi:hypothetical protein LTR10_016774 [Elasticomyces elasticus]|uniref:Uncharacterized protein n=1 Tax=Exophiala sideris TaxID=1016849 RepID=A0ABR0JMS1_9EURO|nr:hypothetical protein LTR10_016774 [Elasticomyces elasticus]KAK5037777.1 hypothetical protein LTS07_001244 [Exophiala sideris]KAK5043759.1 hypothetical protein LTR13_000113 [Exophiala sideris]KAK5067258.1 hypothetical protein LTR69_001245 [Exophiala sideris]KAK5182591.1 hypothetical protein LTR44_004982 [Eurotiomycetes sp. CCFEE 6388]
MSLPGPLDGDSSSSLETTQDRRDSGIILPPPAPLTPKPDASSKSPVAVASTSLESSDTSTTSTPLANDENLTPAKGPHLLPLKFRIEFYMILVVDHQIITDDDKYMEYMIGHDADWQSMQEDMREEDEEGGNPMYQAMEDMWSQRKLDFLRGILELEGGLDVCLDKPRLGWEKWHVFYESEMNFPEMYESDEATLNEKRLRLQEEANFADWEPETYDAPLLVDSVGVRLASRYLECPSWGDPPLSSGGLHEVGEYLDVLNENYEDDKPWDCKPWQCLSIAQHGRVPVTMGLPSKDSYASIPLPVLQHLAYLVIKYEDIILLFTSPWRAGYADTNSEDVESNRVGIVENGNHVCSKFSLGPLEEVKRKIFSKDMTPAKLTWLMNAASYWNYWKEPEKKPRWWTDKFVSFGTKAVTFRQLHGTMDDQIDDWVRFVTALMRLAERKAMEPVPTASAPDVCPDRDWGLREGSKYNNVFGSKDERMTELLDLLEFQGTWRRTMIGYWKKWRSDTNTEFKNYKNCPACLEDDSSGAKPSEHKRYWRRRDYNEKRGDSVPPDDLDGNRRPRTPLPDPPNIDRDSDAESDYDWDGERVDDNDTNSAKSEDMNAGKDGDEVVTENDKIHAQEEVPTVEDDLMVQDGALPGEKRKREAEGDANDETHTPPAKCAKEV